MSKGKTFGQIIREARQEMEYSQKELASFVEISHTYLSKIENDHTDYPPSRIVIASLATLLRLDYDELDIIARRVYIDNQRLIVDLIRRYPQIETLLKRIDSDPAFAKKVISDSLVEELNK